MHINYFPMFYIYAFSKIAIACVLSSKQISLRHLSPNRPSIWLLPNSYWDKPEATQETIDAEGWLHTGEFPMTSSRKIRKVEQRGQAKNILGKA